ncbi:hypothetical protein CBR_g31534 [Chara braunii]|uniref:Right handed beta helix domain-containing protein n=1 Tax=Chara braunii TaxID=69332 RepID=A0A388LF98_CHABU|nr:hypothetical protein CBR_g31534 [Chara braunii]|eukprot:GBG80978.1 hypothetical protein CBR_g31534 [Chara braunii]
MMASSAYPVEETGKKWTRREKKRRRSSFSAGMTTDLARGLTLVSFIAVLILSNGGDRSGKSPSSLFFPVAFETAEAAGLPSQSDKAAAFSSPFSYSSSSSRSALPHRRFLAASGNSAQDNLFAAILNPTVTKFIVKTDINFTASPPPIVNKEFRITGNCGQERCILDFGGCSGFQAHIAGPYPAKITLVNLELRNAVDNALPDSSQSTNGTGTGAALYTNNADVYVRNCIFRRNKASFRGGAIFGDGSSLFVRDSFFCSNHAEEGSGGAVMVARGTTGRFSNVFFGGNTAGGNGGALHWQDSKDLVVLKSTFSCNKAKKSGGAISLFNDDFVFPVSLTSIGFENNCAVDHGGAVFLGVGFSTADFCRNMYFNNTAALSSANGTHPSSNSVFVTVSDQPLFWDIPQRVSFCPTKPEGTSFIATSSLVPQIVPSSPLNGTKIIESCEYCL